MSGQQANRNNTTPALAATQTLFRTFEADGPSRGLTELSNTTSGSLVWQPLRATFRPLNRQSGPPRAPTPPSPPTVPSAPAPPEALALVGEPEASASTDSFRPVPASPATTTSAPFETDEEELPTRVPSGRFRPTRPPSVDPSPSPSPSQASSPANSGSQNASAYRITSECFECICEASTSCNANSRCQTSDVRHTRCGMFLISYDQWLESGLSRQLVSREALARDAAADERAFYECVTERECAERLLAIYMARQARDCDRDGRLTCYDVAALHQAGPEQCNGEPLLDSQYWADFNACFGFARRK